jgi:hypothetical protein
MTLAKGGDEVKMLSSKNISPAMSKSTGLNVVKSKSVSGPPPSGFGPKVGESAGIKSAGKVNAGPKSGISVATAGSNGAKPPLQAKSNSHTESIKKSGTATSMGGMKQSEKSASEKNISIDSKSKTKAQKPKEKKPEPQPLNINLNINSQNIQALSAIQTNEEDPQKQTIEEEEQVENQET